MTMEGMQNSKDVKRSDSIIQKQSRTPKLVKEYESRDDIMGIDLGSSTCVLAVSRNQKVDEFHVPLGAETRRVNEKVQREGLKYIPFALGIIYERNGGVRSK